MSQKTMSCTLSPGALSDAFCALEVEGIPYHLTVNDANKAPTLVLHADVPGHADIAIVLKPDGTYVTSVKTPLFSSAPPSA